MVTAFQDPHWDPFYIPREAVAAACAAEVAGNCPDPDALAAAAVVVATVQAAPVIYSMVNLHLSWVAPLGDLLKDTDSAVSMCLEQLLGHFQPGNDYWRVVGAAMIRPETLTESPMIPSGTV